MQMTTHIAHGTYNVILSDHFTFNDNPQFRKVLETIPDSAVRQVVIHLRRVSFVDSAALGMLLMANDEAQKYNKIVRLSGVSSQLERLFKMAQFDQFFTMQYRIDEQV